MNSKLAITEADLQAYTDGRLSDRRVADIEAYLTATPEEAERINAYRRQNDELRKLFDPVLDEPIPQRLAESAKQPVTPTSSAGRRTWLTRIAATVAWLALGTAMGWFWRDASVRTEQVAAPTKTPASFVHNAALAHATYVPEKRHAVEVAADQEAHLVTWLSKRLGKPVRIPVLAEQGYALVGGRLLPGEDGRPAAQFMYEDPRGARLTLYVKTEAKSSDTAFRYAEENGVSVFYWIDGAFGYALSGSLEKARLLEIANVVFHNIKG